MSREELRYPYPRKLTIRRVVGHLRTYWRILSSSPEPRRVLLLRQEVELLCYAWWRHKLGRAYRLPIETSTVGRRRVTKAIPQVHVNVFGHRVDLLVGTVLEWAPMDEGEKPELSSHGPERPRS